MLHFLQCALFLGLHWVLNFHLFQVSWRRSARTVIKKKYYAIVRPVYCEAPLQTCSVTISLAAVAVTMFCRSEKYTWRCWAISKKSLCTKRFANTRNGQYGRRVPVISHTMWHPATRHCFPLAEQCTLAHCAACEITSESYYYAGSAAVCG